MDGKRDFSGEVTGYNNDAMTMEPYSSNFGSSINSPYGYGPYSDTNQIITLNQPTESDTTVPSHFGLALFVTLFCCWPLGLMAISKNSEAKKKAANGDVAGAREAAASSRTTSIVGIFAGIVIIGAVAGIGVWYYQQLKKATTNGDY